MFDEKPFGLMFHSFHGTALNGDHSHARCQGSIDATELDKLISDVASEYRLLPAKEWMEKAQKGILHNKDVCLTFDDNLLCQFDIALPVLQKHDMTGFWFVYTAPFDGKMCWLDIYRQFRAVNFENFEDFFDNFIETARQTDTGDQIAKIIGSQNAKHYLEDYEFYSEKDRIFRYIRDIDPGELIYNKIMKLMIELSGTTVESLSNSLWMPPEHLKHLDRNDHIIGLHSYTHPTRMDLLEQEHQRREYQCNQASLKQHTGITAHSMSHPCNSFTNDTIDILLDLGIQIGFRADMLKSNTKALDFPRLDHIYAIQAMKK